jgi:FAD binding domain
LRDPLRHRFLPALLHCSAVIVGAGGDVQDFILTKLNHAADHETKVSVIVVEAQPHTGGHAICSGGNLPLGGGTSFQKKWGIKDFPDLVFQDLTDWSVVEPNGSPDYRFNDREVIRAFATTAPRLTSF